MSVVLSPSVIAQIVAGGDAPITSDEWIIAALNLGGILATGDIKSDGSVAFTGSQTFQAGLIVSAGQNITTPAISATANLTLSGVVGTILTKNGTAGSVAIGNAVGNGHIYGVNTVSIVTNGVEKWMVNSSGAFNPIIDNTYDIGNGTVNPRDITVSRNLITGNIVEKTLDVGILISGAASIDGSYILKIPSATAGANVGTQIQLEVSPTPTLLGAGNIWNDSISKGLSFVDGNTNTVTIVRNTGWTASVGTASKAGIDSNDVIYTVGALQNLARWAVAIETALMNTHGLIGT